MGRVVVALLIEQKTVHEDRGHRVAIPLELGHAVLHLGRKDPGPVGSQLDVIEETTRPGHSKLVLRCFNLDYLVDNSVKKKMAAVFVFTLC